MNRDAMRRIRQQASDVGVEVDFDPDAPMDDGNPMGTPEAEIHWQVDVSGYLDRKRAAIAAHASQRTDVGFFLSLPPEAFAASFGTEHYIEPGLPPGMRSGWILDGAAPDSESAPDPDQGPVAGAEPELGTETGPASRSTQSLGPGTGQPSQSGQGPGTGSAPSGGRIEA